MSSRTSGGLARADVPPPVGPGIRGWLLEHADTIAGEIRDHAVEVRGGGVGWLASAPASGGPTATPLGPHLYQGTLGIALYLAACDHVAGRCDHRETVARAVAPLCRLLEGLAKEPNRAAASRVSVGGFAGVGSFVYGLLRIGCWTGDATMVEAARAATLLLTPQRIRADDRLDVVDGCAGAVLALLALDAVDDRPNAVGATPLDLALACGDHLLRQRIAFEGRPLAWPGDGHPPLSGFAHGAAGISHALACLHRRAGRPDILAAAVEGFAFERSLYDPRAENWIDLRFGRHLEQSAWCHGAPGMALARLLEVSGGMDGDSAWRDEVPLLLALTRAHPGVPLDHLCCGNLGRAEVLLCASEALNDPDPMAAAVRLATDVLAARDASGSYRLAPPDAVPAYDPSLMRGEAGVGYALLRLAHPGALPSPLLLA